VALSPYVDANSMHNIATGRPVTRILHSKRPIAWYSRKQATVETATYEFEIVAARIFVELVIDLHSTLRFISVPIREKKYTFGDNEFIDSLLQLKAKLHLCHFMLSFHHVREPITDETLGFYFVPSDDKPADILSKHWGFVQVKERLNHCYSGEGTACIESAATEEEE
jgi:hypothetical protein